MCRFVPSVVLGLLIPCLLLVDGQSTNLVSRCYQYTWLGPRFNNESVYLNATCTQATNMASGIPCFQPLVVSYDGTWPDVNYIWENHRDNASCILANNDVCATYTYYFDGHVENSTSMCTRVVDNNGLSIKSGCYTEIKGSFVTRACFCTSIPGGLPCNGSTTTTAIAAIVAVALAVVRMLNKDFI